MTPLRIVFMGTAELACASLAKIVADTRFTVAAVVTQPDKPKGRQLHLQASPVKLLAGQLSIPILQPPRARDEAFVAQLRELSPDLIVVAAYGQILPSAILETPGGAASMCILRSCPNIAARHRSNGRSPTVSRKPG